MKVFVFEKHTEETASIFRFRGNLDNIHTVNIEEPGEISCIMLSNANNSRCIFTVNHLRLAFDESNYLTMLMTEKLENTHHNKSPEKTGLKLYLQSEKKDIKTATEILNIEKPNSELLEMLLSHYAVLLPGGGIIINLKTPVKNLKLYIEYSMEAY